MTVDDAAAARSTTPVFHQTDSPPVSPISPISPVFRPADRHQDEISAEVALLEQDLRERAGDAAGFQILEPISAPVSLVIFGATGNLAREKLYPALYRLMASGLLPRESTIMACVAHSVVLGAVTRPRHVAILSCSRRAGGWTPSLAGTAAQR